MGYDTDFFGSFKLDRPLDIETRNKLIALHEQENRSPNMPGVWCQWVPNLDGTEIAWDGNEKFYNYIEWLQYVITNILKPAGFVLNGEVEWQGEDRDDLGMLSVKDNVLTVKRGRVVFE